MAEQHLDTMMEALRNGREITLEFPSHGEASAFRTECYRQRAAMRMVGLRDLDKLKFRLNDRFLLITGKPKMILGKEVR